MRISQATPDDTTRLARLLCWDTDGEDPSASAVAGFATDLARWWTDHPSHRAFVARADDATVVGMAWVALAPRVPRPGAAERVSGDIQSVFVAPEHRGHGTGSALVQAATEHAIEHGAGRVTVHSGSRAVPVYERLGFASSPRLMMRHD